MIAIASAIPARVPPTITLMGSPAPPFARPFPSPFPVSLASAFEVGGKPALEAEAEAEAIGEFAEGVAEVRVRVRVAEAVADTEIMDVDVLASPSDTDVVCRATRARGNIIVLLVKLL